MGCYFVETVYYYVTLYVIMTDRYHIYNRSIKENYELMNIFQVKSIYCRIIKLPVKKMTG